MEIDRNGLEILDRATCIRLRLRRRAVIPTSHVARLGISMPEVWSALPTDRPF